MATSVGRTDSRKECEMALSASRALFRDLKQDARRYASLGGWYGNRGFWIGATYRFGRWTRALPKPARQLARIPYRCVDAIWRTLFHVYVSADAEIGPGLCLIHPWSVLIGPASIGENCLIFHEVTLGTNANSRNQFPVIGNNVDIYVGARVLGCVLVEDDVKIGANSVVLNRVPRGSALAPPLSRSISAAAVAAFGPRPAENVQGAREPHNGAKLADE